METSASRAAVKEISMDVAVALDLSELNGTLTLTEEQRIFYHQLVLRTVWVNTINHGFGGTASKNFPSHQQEASSCYHQARLAVQFRAWLQYVSLITPTLLFFILFMHLSKAFPL